MARNANNYQLTIIDNGVSVNQSRGDKATAHNSTIVGTAEFDVEAQDETVVTLFAQGTVTVYGKSNARKVINRAARHIGMNARDAFLDNSDELPTPKNAEELKRETVAMLKANGASPDELLEYAISGTLPEWFDSEEV